MTKETDICLICLHTDRQLTNIDIQLSVFHDKLCDNSVVEYNPRYCSECEYLLRKAYKFKVKCLKAMEIFSKWYKSKGVNKEPITLLCTLLPQSSLAIWTSDDAHNGYSFVHEDVTSKQLETNVAVELSSSGNNNAEDKAESQDFLGNSHLKFDIKIETDETQTRPTEDDSIRDIKDFLVFEDEENEEYEEILFESNGNLEKNEKLSDDEVNDGLNGLSFSEGDDDKLIYLKNEDAKKNNLKQNKPTRKRSLNKDSHSEDEVISTDSKKGNVVKKEQVCNKRNVAKRNKDSKQKVAKKNIFDKDSKRTRDHTRKAIIAELTNVLDSKPNEENDEQNLNLRTKSTFSKERLKEEVKIKFASCGELRAIDGTLIDKEFILHCLDDKASEFVMKPLFEAVYRKHGIKPRALRLFKCIQNKYKNEYDSVFDIEYLNTKEKMIEEFEKRKTYESYIKAEFKCEICYQGFKHEKKLQYHKKCHNESAGEMICSICKMRHRTINGLCKHMTTHEAVYKCKLCPLVTYYIQSMQNHYQQHKGVKYTCKQCDAILGSMSAFLSHMTHCHARHVCTTCGRAYATLFGLRAHITRVHQNEVSASDGATSVKCEECALTFATSEVYYKHMRVTHKQAVRGRPPGTIARKRSDSRPRRGPVLTCRVCNKVGASFGWLQLHFKRDHPDEDMGVLYADRRRHLCDICGTGFSSVYVLRDHMNVHTGARPHACDLCPKRFYSAPKLKEHRMRHFPASIPCPYCGKTFKSKANLYNHKMTHTGEKNHKCNICGKEFALAGNLREHVRGVHYNIRRAKRGGADTGAKRTRRRKTMPDTETDTDSSD